MQVSLFVDDLASKLDKKQKNQLISQGGNFQYLNPCFKLWNLFNRSILHRHHEKMVIIDDASVVGSANIADEYSSYKYGKNMFLDINAFSKSLITHELRFYFKKIADYYGISVHPSMDNETAVRHYNTLYP